MPNRLPQPHPEPQISRPVSASRVVIALENDWPVDVAASRLMNAPVIGPSGSANYRYDDGERLLFHFNRESFELTPVGRSFDALPRLDQHTRIDIVGRGYAPDAGIEGQMSKLSPSQIAELVAPLMVKDGVSSINFIGSHIETAPVGLEGKMTSGFIYDFAQGLRRAAGDDRLPGRYSADLGNVTVDADGEVRAITQVSTGTGWRTWDVDFGRPVLEARHQTDGWLHYSVDTGIPQHDAVLIKDGLPDSGAMPLERHTATPLGEIDNPGRSDSLNNLLELSDSDDSDLPPAQWGPFPFNVDQRVEYKNFEWPPKYYSLNYEADFQHETGNTDRFIDLSSTDFYKPN